VKVLHIISSGGMYGAEAVILHLSQALQKMGDESEIGIFHNSSNPNHGLVAAAAIHSVPTHVISCSGQIDISVPGQIRTLVTSSKADIVHAHGYKADLYTWSALRRGSVPFLSTCHTWYDNNSLLRLYGVLDRRVLRSFAAVVAVSREVQTQLLRAGVPAARISFIRNGIDVEPFRRAPKQAAEALPGNPELRIGLIGRLAPEKGIDLFIRAAARVLDHLPQATFEIFGEGPDRVPLDSLIQALGVSNRVRLAGRSNNMPHIYQSLDLLVSASRQEGLPISLLEGMASGCAILATSVGEVPSIILHGETGILVPPENITELAAAMEALLRDPSWREQLSSKATALVASSYSAEQMALEYRQLYEIVVAAA
jgi:glycosyltransferase involved in cell wall biosynthesis